MRTRASETYISSRGAIGEIKRRVVTNATREVIVQTTWPFFEWSRRKSASNIASNDLALESVTIGAAAVAFMHFTRISIGRVFITKIHSVRAARIYLVIRAYIVTSFYRLFVTIVSR